MKNKSLFFISFLLIFVYFQAFWAESCKYTSEIEKCKESIKSSTTREIEDFVCIDDDNTEKVIYQIILDKKFKEIDKDANEYLSSLEENKDYYFWPKAKESYLEWIEKLEKNFNVYWDYWQRYKSLCDSWIIQETADCLWWSVSVLWAKDFLWNWDCQSLAETKLSIYKEVAYNVLKLNKDQVRKDSRTNYVSEERSMYDKITELFSINLWFLERIWMKWPSKTKKPK